MKKQLAAAGFAIGSIVSGIALGATVFAPSIVGAQEAEAPAEESTTECARPEGRRGGHGLDVAAATIGITEDELREALDGGQTLAEVAAAHDVDLQTVIDAMVADLTARLAEKVEAGDITQEQADARIERATEAMTARANGEEPARPARGERPAPPADEEGAA